MELRHWVGRLGRPRVERGLGGGVCLRRGRRGTRGHEAREDGELSGRGLLGGAIVQQRPRIIPACRSLRASASLRLCVSAFSFVPYRHPNELS